MTTVSVHEAKTHLSRLINDVLAGKDVIISRGKEEVVRIVPLKPVATGKRRLGHLSHLVPPGKDPLEDGFWDPLPEEDLALWNCEVDDPNDAL
jgi:prevent-host-death family protein